MPHVATMATGASPKTPEIDDAVGRVTGVRPDREVVDLTELTLQPAPEAEHVEGLLQVEVLPPTGPEVRPPGPVEAVQFLVLALIGVVAPLVVLVVAVTLPVGRPVQGALLVAGWVVLGIIAKRYETRRRRR